jgi:drug/metabolite transporter (DMT)-like permease
MGILPYVLRNYGYRGLVAELRSAPWSIPVAAGLVFLAYGLVLTAMTFADASYVAPAREMGLLFGVALGALVLKERINTGRIAGTALMIAGLTLITIVQ